MATATCNSRSISGRLFVPVWLALFVTFCERSVRAQPADTQPETLEACAEAYEGSQQSRKHLTLLRAREQLLACLRPECPPLLREDCSSWLEEVERAIPSVTIEATADGSERSDVQVELDGQIIAERLDLRGIEVDPGSHAFRFHLAPFPPVTRTVTLRAGQKFRKISVEFVTPGSQRRSGSDSSPPRRKAPPPETHRPIPTLVYVLGGTTLVAAGSFAYWGLRSNSERSALLDECAPKCTDEDVEPLQRYYLYANISAAVSGAALIGGVVAYLTRPSERITTGSGTIAVETSARGATAAWRWSF